MITTLQKQEIISLVEREKNTLGSYTKVASKCSVAVATITNQILNTENHALVSDSMWVKIGKALGYNFTEKTWQIVETTNYRMMRQVLDLAQSEAMFIAISEKAGSGKTASIQKYKKEDSTNSIFVLQCEEWSRRIFLSKLAQNLGIDLESKGYLTVHAISSRIIDFLKQRTTTGQPLLILDEADKLKPTALRWLIDLYNQLEEQIGCVIAGTENLKKEIKSKATNAVKGYDELDSRFGRKFITLQGCNFSDVQAICQANGLLSEDKIKAVFNECEPKEKLNQRGKYEYYVEDLRRLKRVIKRELKFATINT